MAESLFGTVASIAKLAVLAKEGIKAVGDRQPEYRLFWRRFERQLKPDVRDIPWQRIEDRFWLDPEFIGLACRLIRGEREALNRLEGLFEGELEPPEGSRYDKETLVSTVLGATRDSALQANKDFKGVTRQSIGLIEGRVGEAESAITAEVRAGTSQLAGGHQQLFEQVGALHELVEELGHGLRVEGDQVERSRTTGTASQLSETRPLPSLSDRADSLRTPEELVEALADEDALGAQALSSLLAAGGPSAVVAMVRTRGPTEQGDSLPYLVTAARIAAWAGAFAEAEEVYAWASQLPGLDDGVRARQLVRAAVTAQVHAGEPQFRAHLEEARRLAPEHPGVAIAEARASAEPQGVLDRLADTQPENDADAALLHITRAQASLALGDVDQAGRELAEARSADADNIAVREFESILPLVLAQRRVSGGESPDHDQLRRAADGLQSLRTRLNEQARWDESAQIAARAAEAYALAEEQDAAVDALESVRRVDRLSEEAKADLARSALLTRRPDLVLAFLSASDERAQSRLLRADAQTLSGDAEARSEAVATLRALLEDDDAEIQRQAAFALLAAASTGRDVAWNDRAGDLLKEFNPLTEALLRAEHVRLHSDPEAAERELLPHADHPQALRLLRDYAAQRGDWEKAKDRSRTLLRRRPTARDRLRNAHILHRAGDLGRAREEFFAVARDDDVDEQLREAAFEAITEIVSDGRDYRAVREVAAEWHDCLPRSLNAVWNLAFSLARTSAHREAYELLQETQPQPQVLQQAQLLAEILFRAAPKTEAVQQIAELSSLFGQEERLEALLSLTFVELEEGERAALPDGIGSEIQQRFDTFPDRFPESTLLRRIQAPESAEEFEALMREMHGESAEWQGRVQEDIAAGQAPVNALAVVSPVSQVGLAWSKMTALPLGFSVTALDQAERVVAGGAIGGAAVWDPSTIFVAFALGEGVERLVRAALPGSVIVQETLEDADLAASGPGAARSPTATAGYDPESDRAFFREIPAHEAEASQREIQAMLRIARALEAEPARGEGLDEKLAALLDEDDGVDRAWKPFIGTVLLAHRIKRPVFSDDRWIRQFAREHGVEAFGTIALLDALTDQGVISAEQRTASRLRLAERGGWGLDLTSGEMIEAAQMSQWALTAGLAGALRDRGAWGGRPGERFREMSAFLQAVFDQAPQTFRRWVLRTVDAAQQAMPHMHPSWSAQSLLVMAWGLEQDEARSSDAYFLALVEEVKRLPLRMTTLGHDAVLGALDGILSQFNGEPDRVRFALFVRAFRRLRAPDQLRAWETFIARG